MKETVKKLKVPRTRRFIHVFCFCVFLGLAAGGCSLPQAPGDLSWDTHLVVPLGVRTYGLTELVMSDSALQDSGSGIGQDSTGQLYFSAFTKVNVPLHDSLTVQGLTVTPFPKPAGLSSASAVATLPTQHTVTDAVVNDGTLTLSLRSTSGASGGPVRVTIRNLTSNSGDTLHVTVNTVTTVQRDTVISLHNYHMKPDAGTITISVSAPLNDALEIGARLSAMHFISFSGRINNLHLPTVSSTTDVEQLPQGWNAVHPTTVDAYIHMKGNPTFYHATTDLNVLMHAQPPTGNGVNHTIVRSNVPLAGDTTFVVTGLADMIQIYPETVSATATMTMNGDVLQVSGSDTINLNIEMRSPLSFTLSTMHATGDDQIDTVKIDGAKDIEQEGAMAIIRVWNHLPVGGRVYLVADSIRNNVLSTSHANVDTVIDMIIPIPQLDANGNAISEVMTVDTLMLDSTTITLLKAGELYTRTDLALTSSDGATRVANASDYVKVQIIADLKRNVSTKGND
ncbi:MAG TPA: hypothetical protein VGL38_10315 [bacterium]|jgi:hypothetical protein